MTPFRYAHAANGNWQAATEACVAQLGIARDGEGSGHFGFLYVTDDLADHIGDALALLKRETGVEDWIGSVGMGVCATGREYFAEAGMAVMIADVDPDSYRLFDTVRDDLDAFGEAHGDWARSHRSRFALVHGDPRHAELPLVIAELAEALDGFLVGGLSSSRGNLAQIAGNITEGGVSGILLSGEVPVVTALTQSCLLIGSPHEVTECDENVIAELDGRPALEVFRQDIGEAFADDLQQVAGKIFAALPVRGSDTGDYLVRNLMGLDLQNQLVAIGEEVEAGQAVQFCRREAEAAEQDLVRMVTSLKRRAGGEARGAVYYSCVARGPNMFGDGSHELKVIERELGPVPLVGFFCNGEISHDRLYGYTGVLTLFL